MFSPKYDPTKVSSSIKKLKKLLLNNRITRYIGCAVASFYIRFVYITTTWRFIGLRDIQPYIAEGKPFIFALWHSRMIMLPCLRTQHTSQVHMVISDHTDGDYIAQVLLFFHIQSIRGSTSKHAFSAMRHICKELTRNNVVAITPDGPRGPRQEINSNIIAIASKYETPIIPITYSISRFKKLRSWDHFLIPFPFSKGVCIYGKPLFIKKNATESQKQQAKDTLKARLNLITQDSDILAGIVI